MLHRVYSRAPILLVNVYIKNMFTLQLKKDKKNEFKGAKLDSNLIKFEDQNREECFSSEPVVAWFVVFLPLCLPSLSLPLSRMCCEKVNMREPKMNELIQRLMISFQDFSPFYQSLTSFLPKITFLPNIRRLS